MRSPGCALGDGPSMFKVASAHFYNEATKAKVSHFAYSKLQLQKHCDSFGDYKKQITKQFK